MISDYLSDLEASINRDVQNARFIFNDDTPYNIINAIRPKTLVKGGDYCKENVVGSDIVDNVFIFDYLENKSSSLIINKILNAHISETNETK
jgi:D-beta-D-heptose 7-phosphate kinase/D-beta-D-heptose 1-phosphate adenosyltransferase